MKRKSNYLFQIYYHPCTLNAERNKSDHERVFKCAKPPRTCVPLHTHARTRLTSLASVLCITNKSLHDGLKQYLPWRLKRLPSTGGRQDWGLFPSSAWRNYGSTVHWLMQRKMVI